MDVHAPQPDIYHPIQPAEILPVYTPEQSSQLLVNQWNRYEYPYAHALREMFNEAQQSAALMLPPAERTIYGSDAEVLQEVLWSMDQRLDESDAVKNIRREDFKPESSHDFEAVFRAFDRARDQAFKKVPMSLQQRAHLLHETKSELDWSIRDVYLTGLVDPESFLIMGAKGSKKIQYLTESKDLIAVLRRSGSLKTKEAITNRLRADRAAMERHAELPAVQEALRNQETQKIFEQLND